MAFIILYQGGISTGCGPGHRDNIHSMKGQAGRSTLLKLSGRNSGFNANTYNCSQNIINNTTNVSLE